MHDTRDLTTRLAELLHREHAALADFLIALADFDRERRWLELGHTSLFYFLHRELGLSKGAAFYRKTAAELVQRYPEVIEPLRQGKLCITSVVELAKVITPENRGEVVPRFFHASKREAKAVAAELRPVVVAPHRDVVTVPHLAEPAKAVARLELATSSPDVVVQPDELRGEVPAGPPLRSPLPAASPDEVEPLTGDLRRFHTTVSKRFLAKLAAARDALSHSHPGADTEAVLEAALDLLLAANAKKKGLVTKPRAAPTRPSASPRHIPAEVKRAVWTHDGDRCQWPVASGGVCGSTRRLELDHIVPVARGGASTIANLRVTCRVHNQYAARQAFGDAWMDQFTARPLTCPAHEPAAPVAELRSDEP
ncbi:MAG TPA: HNH endonuclease signature motif containing protein [Anaeromyxobacteraceae bacterium]|nr:HNH endonuclease signature motif containing protein [Anaeromyxobacteraceae bacterium]